MKKKEEININFKIFFIKKILYIETTMLFL